VTAKGTMLFQTTNPATNALTGTANTPIALPANSAQSFLLAFQGNFAFSEPGLTPIFFCQDQSFAPLFPGVDTVDLSFSSTPTPDVIALSATTTNDGILHIPGASGSGAFSVATINVGVGAAITAAAIGSGVMPTTIGICQSDPNTGLCLAPPAASVTTTINQNGTPTFSIFATAGQTIPFQPAANRLTVQFRDAGGALRGSTSVAVTTQ